MASAAPQHRHDVDYSDDNNADSDDGIETSEDDDDASNSENSHNSVGRSTTFTLDGETYSFENPTSLVLAAARQLGMAIRRDAKLLWIADEALLDEYDEEAAAALKTVPERLNIEGICGLMKRIRRSQMAPIKLKIWLLKQMREVLCSGR